MEELNTYLVSQESMPKAVFIMARGPETVFIAGEKTFASEMFNLAKVETAATGFDEFAPLTPESLVSMNPDYLVFFLNPVSKALEQRWREKKFRE